MSVRRPWSVDEHLDNLLRHIELVREACTLLGFRLIESGRVEFGRLLIARGHVHDASKFYGIEWDFLHSGPDVPADKVRLAIEQHVRTNAHHPEYWGGVEHMPEISVAEMVCDWYARSQEFGTGLRDWIEETGIPKFKIDPLSEQAHWIAKFVDMLLPRTFTPLEKE